MTGLHQFNWSPLDRQLKSIGGGGRQTVLRIYIDWPGSDSGIPRFLLDAGIRTNQPARWRRSYPGGQAIVPDYDDPMLRSAMREFIAAFGARYDGAPEIGFVEAGLLGPWGEWLPWKGSAASVDTQREVIDAYQTAFHATKILFRFPSDLTIDRSVGYHDDWFIGKSSEFNSCLEKLGIAQPSFWKTEPAGGRIKPDLQKKLWRTNPTFAIDGDFLQAIRSEHLTYLRVGNSFANIQDFGAEIPTLKVAQALGYELFVSSAAFENSPTDQRLNVSVTITNTGAAPFYYAWPFELSLSKAGKILMTSQSEWEIRKILPGAGEVHFSHAFEPTGIAPGEYKVLLRVVNPLPGGFQMWFANEEQNSSVSGWLTLGTVIF
jgi:hypothetical protein